MDFLKNLQSLPLDQLIRVVALLAAFASKVKQAKADDEISTEEVLEILVQGLVPLLEVFGLDLSDEIDALRYAIDEPRIDALRNVLGEPRVDAGTVISAINEEASALSLQLITP